MKNPFGADGFLTKAGERIPLVNNGIQALHKRAGKEDQLNRARKKDPVGADGWATKACEHLPVVNDVVQKLHKRAGKEEALERAKAHNPLGADGSLTRAGEYVPVVNNAIQVLHKNAGSEEALARARERNPLGAHGYLTQMGEQVPVLNDGIVALHRMAGQSVAEERARGKSLGKLLSRDGAITKVAECVPGLNIVAASLHEASGNREEARRALDLLRNWKEVGNANGALTKVAELMPGIDVIAFALHMNASNYPEALRSITKTKWVHIQVRSFIVDVDCGSVEELYFHGAVASDVSMKPKALCLHGALFDLLLNYLDIDQKGRKRQHARNRRLQDARARSNETYQTLERKLTDAVIDVIFTVVEELPGHVCSALDCASLVVQRRRQESRLVRSLLPPELPRPDAVLLKALQNALPSVRLLHTQLEPPPRVRSRRKPQTERDGYGLPEGMAAVSCFSFLGCLGLGWPMGSCACIAGIAALAAQAHRVVARNAAPLINGCNADAWAASARAPGPEAAPRGARAMSASASSGLDEAPAGVVAELAAKDAKILSLLLRSYVLEQLLSSQWAGFLLSMLEPLLRLWLGGMVCKEADDGTVPLAFDVEVPEQVVPDCGGPGLDLWLPTLRFAVLLDVSTAGRGPLLQRVRCAAPDALVGRVIEEVRRQLVRWDLRAADARLKHFEQPVHASFDFGLEWRGDEQLRLQVSGLTVELHLPS